MNELDVSKSSLGQAAYPEEIKAVVRLVNICKGRKSFTTPMRQEAVEAVNAALAAEKKAIEKIKTALAVLPAASK